MVTQLSGIRVCALREGVKRSLTLIYGRFLNCAADRITKEDQVSLINTQLLLRGNRRRSKTSEMGDYEQNKCFIKSKSGI